MSAYNITAGGRTVGIFEKGEGDPLVYLHGFADLHGVKSDPFPFHRALSDHRRMIAPAHPGCGETEEYADLDHVQDSVFHYLEVLDALKLDRFDLVGHCLGGWFAAEFAVRHPERVKSLTLIGASGLFVPDAPIGDIFMMAQPGNGVEYTGLRDMLFGDGESPLATSLFPDGRGEIEDEIRRYQMLRLGSFIGFKPPYFYNRSLVNRLYRVDCPALVIWGENDSMVPRAIGEAYAKGLPGARSLHVVPDTGHACHLEAPEAVTALVQDFLDA